MTAGPAGTTIESTVQWLQYEGGPPDLDVTGVTVTITPLAGGTPLVNAAATGAPGGGVNSYAWVTTAATPVGSYLWTWSGTDTQNGAVTATEVIEVTTGYSTAWASVSDVLEVTGKTVTSAKLAEATGVINIYAGRSPAASVRMSARQLYWLQQATCWQAAWQSQQAGYELRSNAAGVSQDGLHVQRETEHSVTLAPLAARALKNLPWIGSKTLRTPNISARLGLGATDFTNETSDEYSTWRGF